MRRSSRRRFFALGAAAATLAALRPARCSRPARRRSSHSPATSNPSRATSTSRASRRRQRSWRQHGIGALLIEPGASLVYFTGVHWWRSERLTAAVLPREGEPRHRHAAFRRALGAREPEGSRRRPRTGTRMRIRSSRSPESCATARSLPRSASRRPCVTSPSTGSCAPCRTCRS